MDRTAGLPPPSSPILERQDSPDMIALLKAMTVSHRRARRLDVVTVAVSVVLAGSSLAALTGMPRLRLPQPCPA